MKTLKGQNFRATITTASQKKYFAGSQSCTVHVAADLEEVSTKDSTNGWKEQEVVAMSWDGSVNGLVIMDADTNAVVKLDAIDMVGATLDMSFVQTYSTKNRDEEPDGIKYEGQAIMNDGSFQFGNKANSTYTLQFTGNGELKKSTVSSQSE